MQADSRPDEPEDAAFNVAAESQAHLRAIRRSLVWILIILGIGGMYAARAVLLPVVLAILLTLVLRPPVRWLGKLGLSVGISSVAIVLFIAALFIVAGLFISAPVADLIERAPEIIRDLRWKMRDVIAGFTTLQEMTTGEGESEGSGLNATSMIATAAASVASTGSAVIAALVLALFLLASGDLFHSRIVEVSPRLTDKKRSLLIARDVERQVSRYLGAITVINAGMGVAVGLALWALGMPNPLVWGIAACFLNYLPFLGGIIGVSCVAAIAVVTFDTVSQAMLAPLAYLLVNGIEGQFVTPMVVGRRLELNTASTFATVVFWVWLWGVPGALLAMPMLVVIKVISDNVESLNGLGRFLASE